MAASSTGIGRTCAFAEIVNSNVSKVSDAIWITRGIRTLRIASAFFRGGDGTVGSLTSSSTKVGVYGRDVTDAFAGFLAFLVLRAR